MNIDVERFLALTALLAAPLVAAPGCIINTSDDDDDDTGSASNSNGDTTTNGTNSTTDGETSGSSSATTSPVDTGESTFADETLGEEVTGSDESTFGSDSTTGADLGNCCVADHGGLGCEIPEVSDCVCAMDPACCEEGWDSFCVGEVNKFGCGTCELPGQVWDCTCPSVCDDKPIEGLFQVCGGDEAEAATNGQAACEAELGMSCSTHTCEECVCASAELPEIEC